jgi:hypothetical protein
VKAGTGFGGHVNPVIFLTGTVGESPTYIFVFQLNE